MMNVPKQSCVFRGPWAPCGAVALFAGRQAGILSVRTIALFSGSASFERSASRRRFRFRGDRASEVRSRGVILEPSIRRPRPLLFGVIAGRFPQDRLQIVRAETSASRRPPPQTLPPDFPFGDRGMSSTEASARPDGWSSSAPAVWQRLCRTRQPRGHGIGLGLARAWAWAWAWARPRSRWRYAQLVDSFVNASMHPWVMLDYYDPRAALPQPCARKPGDFSDVPSVASDNRATEPPSCSRLRKPAARNIERFPCNSIPTASAIMAEAAASVRPTPLGTPSALESLGPRSPFHCTRTVAWAAIEARLRKDGRQ
jgi:hypothetical protein